MDTLAKTYSKAQNQPALTWVSVFVNNFQWILYVQGPINFDWCWYFGGLGSRPHLVGKCFIVVVGLDPKIPKPRSLDQIADFLLILAPLISFVLVLSKKCRLY